MHRLYENLVLHHLQHYDQMIFLAGPRQVGKTTISRAMSSYTSDFYYFNWDEKENRQQIISGATQIAQIAELHKARTKKPIIVFDEIHKYRKWKQFLKGFYDVYKDKTKIIVTGSAKLNIYKHGSDSLMGRYFLYRIHPLSVAELIHDKLPKSELFSPKEITKENFNRLLIRGGFPQPYLKNDLRFSNNWQRLRHDQLFQEDIRSLTKIQEFSQFEMLADILKSQTGQLVNYANLANTTNVSTETIIRWINTLEATYYCFSLKPWFKNVNRSLRKQPKIYLWDWSVIHDEGARAENFIAAHLHKAVQYWTDSGLGNYGLYFLRDKEKREVDFLITKNQKPWFAVEVKNSHNNSISKSLYYYHDQLKLEHAFQVVMDTSYINKNCFDYADPIMVSVKTLLSQFI